jgi:lysophospholipase L1-like esterase
MIRGPALRAAIAAALLAGGIMAGRLSVTSAPAPLICRPSAPERAAIGRRAVLLFGNSQLHDGDWRFPGALAVNCARQGMTLREGLAAAPDLPEVAPAVVILGFGAVEALRAPGAGRAVDADAIARDMADLLGGLRARWPEAELIVSAIPPMRPDLLPQSLRGAARIDAINAALARAGAAAGAAVIDPALPVDAGGLSRAMTHDGVHLTETAYALWQAQIIAASARLAPR